MELSKTWAQATSQRLLKLGLLGLTEYKFDEGEARDDSGKWTSGGGGGAEKPAEAEQPTSADAEATSKAASDAATVAAKSGKPEDDIKAADAYDKAAKAQPEGSPKAKYYKESADAWRASATADRTPKTGKGGKGKHAAAHKKAAGAHKKAQDLGKHMKALAADTAANIRAEKAHAKATGQGILMADIEEIEYVAVDMSDLPKRLGEGKLLVPGRYRPVQIDREHRDYYTWLARIPQVKRYRLMVGGEDLLG